MLQLRKVYNVKENLAVMETTRNTSKKNTANLHQVEVKMLQNDVKMMNSYNWWRSVEHADGVDAEMLWL